jgi:hypothetical protein
MRGMATAAAPVIACLEAATVAACAARAAEPVERPRAKGLTAAEVTRRNEHYKLLVAVGTYGPALDPRQPARATPTVMTEEMPPAPVVLPPVRPRTRGDALALADLALQRGDALDAAAQYRALLDRGDVAIAGYVNVQLAHAYLALRDVDRAYGALRAAIRSPDTAWYALAELATLEVRTYAPISVLQELAPLLPPRAADLENLLIQLAKPEEVARVLEAKVERDRRDEHACGYALAAIARGSNRDRYGLGSVCETELARAVAVRNGALWVDTRNATRRILADNMNVWRTTGANARVWLETAEGAEYAMSLAQSDADAALASRTATAALANVLRSLFDGDTLDDDAHRRFDIVVEMLAPADQRIIANLLSIPPPQPGAP